MSKALATPEVVPELLAENALLLAENALLRAALAKATHEASHDVLTGLSNRAALPQADEVVHRAIDRGDVVVVAVLDLIGFKRINDHHGHATGDAVLAEFARRLITATRPGEMALRLGGDEFVLILLGEAQIDQRLDAIRHHLTRPIVVNDHVLQAVPRMGAVLATRAPVTTLIDQADTAMYRSQQGSVVSHTAGTPQHIRTLSPAMAGDCGAGDDHEVGRAGARPGQEVAACLAPVA